MNEFIPFDIAEFSVDDKATLINYLNEEQLDELMSFAVALLSLRKQDLLKVSLQDIGKTGLLLEVSDNQPTQKYITQTHFLPFYQSLNHRDDFQQQYILLVQQSAKILGKASIELKKRQFTLLEKYSITANMVRLVLQSEQDLSHLPAGYAFLLNTQIAGSTQNRVVRYYTLRKAWQQMNTQNEIQNLAWIDVFCHGEKNGAIGLGESGLGERWVKSLKIGDTVISEREFPEKIDHFAVNGGQGQSLLIADETSLPTVARLLETWQQTQLPIVLTFLQDGQNVAYLNDVLQNHPAVVLPVIADSNQNPYEQIFATLSQFLQNNPTQIDSVWGGLEATTTKKLRPILCNLLRLNRDKMVLKVYWRKQE